MLDNEAPETHWDAIEESDSKYETVLPNVSKQNEAKIYMRTLEENIVRVLASSDEKFPM